MSATAIPALLAHNTMLATQVSTATPAAAAARPTPAAIAGALAAPPTNVPTHNAELMAT
ncbi:hypothetical protein [Ottowia thiooxydans]|uniref:hypothetical protein n=1 Tax=Ottowia thiooxydans TaxID=219182 RepID=UPI0012EBFA38|nr:hypothetical protein [Ottowia thiooxydans]